MTENEAYTELRGLGLQFRGAGREAWDHWTYVEPYPDNPRGSAIRHVVADTLLYRFYAGADSFNVTLYLTNIPNEEASAHAHKLNEEAVECAKQQAKLAGVLMWCP